MGHGRHYCQMATWCKFCTSDTHATQACWSYEKFVKDNPIASSRRNTPVPGQKIVVNTQEPNQRPLFPYPPVQRFNPPVILQIEVSKQLPHQRSCQDVRMDPHYQKPPHYADIHQHRPVQQTPIEINEIGPTIQQGMIQCPVQRGMQAAGA